MRNIPIHLIIFIILLAFSAISWVYRQLKAQQAVKRIKDIEEQRQLEVLRTGRDPAAELQEDTGETQRQRELAARREAQLTELRRRAQERARQQSHEPAPPTAPTSLPQHIPGSTGPTVSSSPPPSTVRIPPRQTSRVQSQSQPLPAVRAKAKQSAAKVPIHATLHDEPVIVKAPPVAVVQINFPRTPEEWRRAIIASEIMSQPLSIRQAPPPIPF